MDSDLKVVITRSTWDRYFFRFTVILVVAGVAIYYFNGETRQLGMPIPAILMWIMMRHRTPRDGFRSPTLFGTPGMVPLVIWLSTILLIAGLLMYADFVVMGQRFSDPLQLYHVPFVVGVFVTLLVGVAVIERKWGRSRKQVR